MSLVFPEAQKITTDAYREGWDRIFGKTTVAAARGDITIQEWKEINNTQGGRGGSGQPSSR